MQKCNLIICKNQQKKNVTSYYKHQIEEITQICFFMKGNIQFHTQRTTILLTVKWNFFDFWKISNPEIVIYIKHTHQWKFFYSSSMKSIRINQIPNYTHRYVTLLYYRNYKSNIIHRIICLKRTFRRNPNWYHLDRYKGWIIAELWHIDSQLHVFCIIHVIY